MVTTLTKKKPAAKGKTKTAKRLSPPRRVSQASEGPAGYIGILTDASGSMEGKWMQTIQAFNNYIIDTARGMKGKRVTLQVCQFSGRAGLAPLGSGGLRHVFNGDVGAGFKLSRENYIPEGGTPLIDACCQMIDMAKQDFAPRKIIVIQTDGEENQSRIYTKDDLKQRIAQATEAGWQIIFLGVGIDGFAEAGKYGFSAVNTVSMGAHNLRGATQSLGNKTMAFFGSGQAMVYNTKDRVALNESSLTGMAASAAAGAAADALEVNVKIKKHKGKK